MDIVIRGTIEHGDKRGRELGYPTINMALNGSVDDGVYAATVTIKGETYGGVCFIGAAKTFGKTQRKVETHIFDFSGDVYGEIATVRIVERIRGTVQFSSAQELKEAIADDIDKCKQILTLQ
jgi:riboflavin kinase/FMN adenylyltransferase